MTLTRWKLMAGVLGLSLGGLAALAESPAKPGKSGSRAATPADCPGVCPIPVAGPPTDVALPTPVQMAAPGPVVLPLTGPLVASPADLVPVEAKETAPAPRKADKASVELTLPVTDLPVAAKPELPAPAPTPLVPASPPAPAIAAAPVITTAPAVAVVPAPVPAPLTPAPAPAVVPVVAEPVAATPAALPTAQPSLAEKKLRVLLNMGDDRPRFEVRDGEEALLKVVCDKVDVKSPSDRGETMSVMKAVKTVTFVTPGGEGVCDELSLTPGTGQVIVTGNVRFKYNWGKVETEVSGDRMTFRLGSAPGVTPAPASTFTPTSYQRPAGR